MAGSPTTRELCTPHGAARVHFHRVPRAALRAWLARVLSG
jgi:hypothetical protein